MRHRASFTSRRSSEPVQTNQAPKPPETGRHATVPSFPQPTGSSQQVPTHQPQAMSSRDPHRIAQEHARRNSEPHRERTENTTREPQRREPPPITREESFTTDVPLKPTFSPSIVRTPEQYQRRASDGDSNTLGRHSSLPPSSYTRSSLSSSVSYGASSLSDEPSSVFDPALGASSGRKPSSLGRSSTEPVLVPPQNRTGDSHRINMITDAQRQQWLTSPDTERRIREAGARVFGDDRRAGSRSVTPSPPSRLAPSPGTPHTYYESAEYLRTPSSVPEPMLDPPPHWTRRLRKGYWNRRGDHLTADDYIIYAPPQLQNPPELRGYPAHDDGYVSHLDEFKPYLPHRKEHAGSLPVQGRPAKYPYEKVSLISALCNVF